MSLGDTLGDTNTKNLKNQNNKIKYLVNFHVSHDTCHMLPVTCHLSSVPCHLTTTMCSFTCYESQRRFGDAAAGGLVVNSIKNSYYYINLRNTLFRQRSLFLSVKKLHGGDKQTDRHTDITTYRMYSTILYCIALLTSTVH